MLAVINVGLGANTSYKNRTINFMRAIKAVVTAPAGSTPTCNVISNPAGSLEANQMITVLSNTVAGGWSVDTANGNIGDTYSDSYSAPYVLHLYTDSGKNQFPYRCFTIRTSPSYAFSSSFDSYPHLAFYNGVSNNTVFGTAPYNGNYVNGIANTSILMNDPRTSWSNYTIGSAATGSAPFNIAMVNYLNDNYSSYMPGTESINTFYVAATSEYIIIINRAIGMIYSGTRTTQPWEDLYDDNPPVVGISFTGGVVGAGSSVYGWTRTLSGTGDNLAANNAYSKNLAFNTHSSLYSNNSYHSIEPVTGIPMAGGASVGSMYGSAYQGRVGYTNISNTASNGWYNMPAPMFFSAVMGYVTTAGYIAGNQYNSYPTMLYAPDTDNTTGALTPPAVPIVFQIFGASFNPGGRIKGLYKSLSGNTPYCYSIGSNRQIITVNEDGANTDYMLIHTHPGLFSYSNTMTDSFLVKVA